MKRPLPEEYPPAFAGYVGLVPETDVLAALRAQIGAVREFAATVAPDRETHAYAPGKWTIRQVVGHAGDAERVFGYRALCISRGEQTPLPGFDENAYVASSPSSGVRLADLVEELVFLRSANLKMLEALREEQWTASGVANQKLITVRALAFVMAGHVRHHLNVLRDRYAAKAPV